MKFLRADGQYAVFSVASGSYQFTSAGAGKMLQKSILPAPMIHPGDTLANHTDTILVKIGSDVPGTKIYFTTNGSEPDSLAILYKNGFKISKLATIKAKAFLKGYEASFTSVRHIEFIDESVNGLEVNYYSGAWTKLPDFAALPVVKQGRIFNFSLEKIAPPKDQFALVMNGKLLISKSGTYEFFLRSNDGSRLFIDNQMVIDNDGSHSADSEKPGKIELSEGIAPNPAELLSGRRRHVSGAKIFGPGIEKQTIPATVIFRR